MEDTDGQDLENRNANFWDELCGTQLAQSIGVVDQSKKSIAKFDHWYMEFYPYLDEFIKKMHPENKVILEIGLGYGTVSEILIERSAEYCGLDIARGPVSMVELRAKRMDKAIRTLQASALKIPIDDGMFDGVVAIGSLHHTGNLKLAINEVFRVLSKNGAGLVMVYNAYSYRRWITSFGVTSRYLIQELFGYRGPVQSTSMKARSRYDTNSVSEAAPHTDWISKRSMKHLLRQSKSIKITKLNIGSEFVFKKWSRDRQTKSIAAKFLGLDLYCEFVV